MKISFSTFKSIYKSGGGIKTFAAIVVAQCTLHYLEVYTIQFRNCWIGIDEQNNFADFTLALYKLLFIIIIDFSIEVGIEFGLAKKITTLS